MNINSLLSHVLLFLCLPIWAWGSVSTPKPDWVSIPAGSIEVFWMAPLSNQKMADLKKKDPKKELKVIQTQKVAAFEMMKNAVTESQFHAFLQKYPKWGASKIKSMYADSNYLKNFNAPLAASSEKPITYVSWFVAREYCDHIGGRLPTVIEWEYVAAASEKKWDANRDPEFLERILIWYGQPQASSLRNVGEGYRNRFGIHDLHGLIWEWVEDFNSIFVNGESREDSSFNKDMFCGAGGIGSANKENYAAFMRMAFRSALKGKSTVWNLGFRCVRDLQ